MTSNFHQKYLFSWIYLMVINRKSFRKGDDRENSEANQAVKQNKLVTIPPDAKKSPQDITEYSKGAKIENVVAKSCVNINEIKWLIPIAETLRTLHLCETIVEDWSGLGELKKLRGTLMLLYTLDLFPSAEPFLSFKQSWISQIVN